MRTMAWKNLIGQERVKHVLGSAFSNGTLGHAYLLAGDEGRGTFQAALEMAQGLLCEAEGEVPCGACESCRKIESCAHPDLNIILPVCLLKEHRGSSGELNQAGWEFVSGCIKRRVAEPYVSPEQTGIPDIPVDWIREVMRSVSRGTIRGRANVTIVCSIDAMKQESSNALLKTLEEPPPGSYLFLCTDTPHAVLPTVVSRCQVLRLGELSVDQMRAFVRQRCAGAVSTEVLEGALHSAQGSVGKALHLLGESYETALEKTRLLWSLVDETDWIAIARGLEALTAGAAYPEYEQIFSSSLHLIRNSLLRSTAGSEKYITVASNMVWEPLSRLSLEDIERLAKVCEKALADMRVRGNSMLVLATFIMSAQEIAHGKE